MAPEGNKVDLWEPVKGNKFNSRAETPTFTSHLYEVLDIFGVSFRVERVIRN